MDCNCPSEEPPSLSSSGLFASGLFAFRSDGTGLVQSDKNEQDYKEELAEFIAPTYGRGYYEFNVTSLRPRECRWFSRGMLIKPKMKGSKSVIKSVLPVQMGNLKACL